MIAVQFQKSYTVALTSAAWVHPLSKARSSARLKSTLGWRSSPLAPRRTTVAVALASSTRSSSTEKDSISDSSSSSSSSSNSASEINDDSTINPLVTTTLTTAARLPRANLSIDVKTIVSHLPVVLSHLQSRKASSETVAAATAIAESLQPQRVQLIQQRDLALNQRKDASAVVGTLKRLAVLTNEQQDELDKGVAASNQAGAVAEQAESALAVIQDEMDRLLASIPNLLDDQVPDGSDDRENKQVLTWGDIHALPTRLGWQETDKSPAWHDDIAIALNGYKAEAAVQMSGARFAALRGDVARLERALGMFFMDLHTEQHGYTEVSVPFVVSRSALEGTSQLPKFELDLFAIRPESHTCNGEDAFLIPTAEVPVTNLHRNQVLDEDDLPLSYVAWTPCFRAEAGSYGRDTRGLIRTHQFQKVELVKITTAETSNDQHEELTRHAEACLQALRLPYRKMRLCSGDIGFAARHCYDLEVWLPGAGEYREISSCSNTGDFQARRMALRYRPKPASGAAKKEKSKPILCHTINGSGLAVGRTLVAVLENYQRPDGSVEIPEVLRPYMGGKDSINP